MRSDLISFLCDRFSASELRMFVADHFERLVHQIDFQGSASASAASFLDAIGNAGASTLWSPLLRARPSFSERIAALREAWTSNGFDGVPPNLDAVLADIRARMIMARGMAVADLVLELEFVSQRATLTKSQFVEIKRLRRALDGAVFFELHGTHGGAPFGGYAIRDDLEPEVLKALLDASQILRAHRKWTRVEIVVVLLVVSVFALALWWFALR